MQDNICKSDGCNNLRLENGPTEIACFKIPGTQIEILVLDWGNPHLEDYCLECIEDSA